MKIRSLGHVVVRVSDLARSEKFYNEVLGLPVCAHYDDQGMKMAFFTLGDHHDFAILQSSSLGDAKASGLDHVAFKIGDAVEELVAAKEDLEGRGIKTTPIDHLVTKSIYIADPDGNGVELYIDASDAWREDPQKIAHGEPLEI